MSKNNENRRPSAASRCFSDTSLSDTHLCEFILDKEDKKRLFKRSLSHAALKATLSSSDLESDISSPTLYFTMSDNDEETVYFSPLAESRFEPSAPPYEESFAPSDDSGDENSALLSSNVRPNSNNLHDEGTVMSKLYDHQQTTQPSCSEYSFSSRPTDEEMLSKNNEVITLENNKGRLHESVEYDDKSPECHWSIRDIPPSSQTCDVIIGGVKRRYKRSSLKYNYVEAMNQKNKERYELDKMDVIQSPPLSTSTTPPLPVTPIRVTSLIDKEPTNHNIAHSYPVAGRNESCQREALSGTSERNDDDILLEQQAVKYAKMNKKPSDYASNFIKMSLNKKLTRIRRSLSDQSVRCVAQKILRPILLSSKLQRTAESIFKPVPFHAFSCDDARAQIIMDVAEQGIQPRRSDPCLLEAMLASTKSTEDTNSTSVESQVKGRLPSQKGDDDLLMSMNNLDDQGQPTQKFINDCYKQNKINGTNKKDILPSIGKTRIPEYIRHLMPKSRDPRLDDPDLITIETVPVQEKFPNFLDQYFQEADETFGSNVKGFDAVNDEENQILWTSNDISLLRQGLLSPSKAELVMSCLKSSEYANDDIESNQKQTIKPHQDDCTIGGIGEDQQNLNFGSEFQHDQWDDTKPRLSSSPNEIFVRKCLGSENIPHPQQDIANTTADVSKSHSYDIDPDLVRFFLEDILTSSSSGGSIEEVSSEEADREVSRIMEHESSDDVDVEIDIKSENSADWTLSSDQTSDETDKIMKDKVSDRIIVCISDPTIANKQTETLGTHFGSTNDTKYKTDELERAKECKMACDFINECSSTEDSTPPKEFHVEINDKNDHQSNIGATQLLLEDAKGTSTYQDTRHAEEIENPSIAKEVALNDFLERNTNPNKPAYLTDNPNSVRIPKGSNDVTSKKLAKNQQQTKDTCSSYELLEEGIIKKESTNMNFDINELPSKLSSDTLLNQLPPVPDHTLRRTSSPSADIQLHSSSGSNMDLDRLLSLQGHVGDSGIGLSEIDSDAVHDHVDYFEQARFRRGHLLRWEMNLLLTELSTQRQELDGIMRESRRAKTECRDLKTEVDNLVHKLSDVGI